MKPAPAHCFLSRGTTASLLAAALTAGVLFSSLSAFSENLPNVIIVYSDDHGYTDLGIHGIDPHVDTPHMDALAGEGALMTSGYCSAPQCRPSRCGLLAGRIQNEFGFSSNGSDAGAGEGALPLVYPPGTDMAGQPLLTIADRMKQLGYVTGFSGKWHCGLNDDPKQKTDPRSRGFDEYWVAPLTRGVANIDLKGNLISHQKVSHDGENRVILQGKYAEAFVTRNKDKPFFLYFPIFGPHVPMIKKSDPYYVNFQHHDYPQYTDEQDDHRRLGLALIKAMDDAIGGLVATLKKHNLEENTLILFSGDNGAPGKFNTSAIGSWNGSNNVPMRGPKGSLHEGGIRVPMFASWKGTIPPGLIIEEMVTALDFTATTLAAAGADIPSEFDGVNLLPRLKGETDQIERDKPMFWDFYSGQAVRTGDWKLWRDDKNAVLFNIAEDPAEVTNLAYQQPKRLQELEKLLDDWSDSLLPSARYDPAGRGSKLTPAFAGAPSNIKPDPRYLLPYEKPVATPYPAAVQSPGGPALEMTTPAPEKTSPKTETRRQSQEGLFRNRDRNKDGVITLKEFIGNPEGRNVTVLTERYKKMDRNSDGKITLKEMTGQ